MSGIAGIFNRNLEPVNPQLLNSMTQSVHYRGPDGTGRWIEGPLGVSQLLLATTPESVDEHSPMHDEISGLVMVFDGRVDNRRELSDALRSNGIFCRTETDMELVLKAFKLWGQSCVEKILGDFAFAIWDKTRKQLFCARDIMGCRPFLYSASNRHFVFGSEIRQLMLHPAVSRTVNKGMVADYIANEIHNLEETLYQDICTLPPAHSLLVDGHTLSIKRYWELTPKGTIRYAQDSQYVEHYLELLRHVVDCRLRSSGRVGATMSGGLDSTSVVGMAQSIYNQTGSQKKIFTFSTTFPGRDCDEKEKIRAMTKMWDLESFFCPFVSFSEKPAWEQMTRDSLEPPDSPIDATQEPLLKEAKANNVRVLLSGYGPDGLFGGSAYPYMQALRGLDLSFAIRFFAQQVSEQGFKPASRALIKSLGWPLMPRALLKLLMSKKWTRKRPYFLSNGFLSTSKFAERQKTYPNAWRFRDLSYWKVNLMSVDAKSFFHTAYSERMYAKYGVEQRHPFYDRRMLEFAMAVPDPVKLKGGCRKRIVLQGSRDLIPSELQHYPNYAHFSNCLQEALKVPLVQNTLKALELSKAGWVRQEKVTSVLSGVMERSCQGLEIYEQDYRWLEPLWTLFALEIWFRHAGSDALSVEPSGM